MRDSSKGDPRRSIVQMASHNVSSVLLARLVQARGGQFAFQFEDMTDGLRVRQEQLDVLKRLKRVLERHNLMKAWSEFCLKAAIKNPLLDIE